MFLIKMWYFVMQLLETFFVFQIQITQIVCFGVEFGPAKSKQLVLLFLSINLAKPLRFLWFQQIWKLILLVQPYPIVIMLVWIYGSKGLRSLDNEYGLEACWKEHNLIEAGVNYFSSSPYSSTPFGVNFVPLHLNTFLLFLVKLKKIPSSMLGEKSEMW